MSEKALDKILRKAREDPDILAVLLFGSRARGESTPQSDVDVCLVLANRPYDPLFLSEKKLEALSAGELDVRVFQQLPLYIRRRVLREGKVLFVRNEAALYELAFRTAQSFEDFRHRYDDYLKAVGDVGS